MDKIGRYVSDTFSRISYPHSEYEELRNCQIPDQNTRDSEVSVNSNNGSITTESIHVAHSLKTGWKSRVISTKSSWGGNTHSIIYLGWGINVPSNEGSDCT